MISIYIDFRFYFEFYYQIDMHMMNIKNMKDKQVCFKQMIKNL